MRIAIIADPIYKQSAGIYTFTVNFINSLLSVDQKNEYHIFGLEKDHFNNAFYHYVPNTIPFLKNDPVRTFYQLPLQIKKADPDVVVEPAHFGPFNLPDKIKRVTIIHDLTPVKYPQYHKHFSQMLQRVFLPGILKRADLIITNSQNTMQDVIEYSPESGNKTHFIHLGKEKIFKPVQNPDVLAKYGLKKSYFLYVGTIEPRKNLSFLLKAYELFRAGNPGSVDLVIIGRKGWKSKKFYKALAQNKYKKDIKLPGFVLRQDLPAIFTGALAFVFPSLYEGFGLPVLEAMSCGTPCLVSNIGSLKEVIGESGMTFHPDDSAKLVNQLTQIYQDHKVRDKLSKDSLRRAAIFSWDKFAKTFISLIGSL